jgi:hypothetical protein
MIHHWNLICLQTPFRFWYRINPRSSGCSKSAKSVDAKMAIDLFTCLLMANWGVKLVCMCSYSKWSMFACLLFLTGSTGSKLVLNSLWKWLELEVLEIQTICLNTGLKIASKTKEKKKLKTKTKGSFWNQVLNNSSSSLQINDSNHVDSRHPFIEVGSLFCQVMLTSHKPQMALPALWVLLESPQYVGSYCLDFAV